MESLSEYTNVWALYLAAGLIGLWCWGRMAFWVKSYGLGYHLFSALGAVLIFTPVPVDMASSEYLAPGFLAAVVAFISHDQSLLSYYGIWYLITLVIALVTVMAFTAAGQLPSQKAGHRPSAARKTSRRQKEAAARAEQRASAGSSRPASRKEPRL